MRRAPTPRPAAAEVTDPPRRELGPSSFGPLLIGLGALFLIDRFAWAVGIQSLLWVLLLGLGAAAFFFLYGRDRRHWWALFPAFGLVALAAAMLAGNVGGGLLLGLAGVVCIVLYLRGTGRRWLMLVGGALVSLALMAVFEGAFPRLDNGWLLFAGLGATLYLLHRRSPGAGGWSLYLAIALGALALISLFTGRVVETLIAVALIASGTAMVWRGRQGEATYVPADRVPEPAPAPAPAEPVAAAAEPEPADVNRPLWARIRRGRR